MKAWQRTLLALAERPRTTIELAAALGSSVPVARAALNALARTGGVLVTGGIYTITPAGRAYTLDMDEGDTTRMIVGMPPEDTDAIVRHAMRTQPASVWELATSTKG